ncbi:MAG: hypothetical protein ACOVP4_11925 [Bacteriovoracaceae bacterium]
MTELYFIIRHTPFWATPIMILGAEFGYLFWLKKKKATVTLCMLLLLFGAICNCFYIWAGGPEKSVRVVRDWHRSYILD